MTTPFDIDVGVAGVVTGLHHRATPSERGPTTVILAHGAGGPQLSPFMTAFSSGLSTHGIDVVTFNFVYMERGRRAPDPKARLEHCYRAAIDATRRVVPSARSRLIIGGKSMGGRIASQVAAADAADLGVNGLVFLGYPLHPPGRPEKRRDGHLPDVGAPMLFVQGSRDAFGTEAELRPVVEACQRAQLHVVAGGDHSLKVRGKGAPSVDEVHASVQEAIVEWLDGL